MGLGFSDVDYRGPHAMAATAWHRRRLWRPGWRLRRSRSTSPFAAAPVAIAVVQTSHHVHAP